MLREFVRLLKRQLIRVITFFEKNNKLSWIVTIVGAILIFYISSLTSPAKGIPTTNLIPILYHILAFFSFTFFLLISSLKGRIKPKFLTIAILIAITYAILDELHQFFVPGRSCALQDVFLDSVGIVFASMIYLIKLKLN